MKKHISLLPCLALLTLAGCGGGGGGSTSTATTPTTTTTNPSTGSQTTASVDVTPCLSQLVAPGRTVASLVVPDVLSLNLNATAGFPNGRLPIDPVIDTELAVLLLDLTKTGADTFVKLPLNPPASSGNILPYTSTFPYLQVANGGAPVATGGSGFVFRTELASAYTRVDRMGEPAVATALVRAPSKNAYNDDSPVQDATGKWAPEFTADLTEITTSLLDDLKPTGLPLCAKVS